MDVFRIEVSKVCILTTPHCKHLIRLSYKNGKIVETCLYYNEIINLITPYNVEDKFIQMHKRYMDFTIGIHSYTTLYLE